MANNFVGFWNFNNNNAAAVKDYSTKGQHSTSCTDLTIGAGDVVGYAATFNGTTSEVNFGNITSLNAIAAFTIMAKIAIPAATGKAKVITAKSGHHYLYVDAAGNIVFEIDFASVKVLTSAAVISYNVYHTIVAVYDGATMSIYVDGVKDATTLAATGNTPSNGNDFLLGNDGFADGLTGAMECCAAWTRALDTDEIEFVSNNPNGTPRLTNGDTVATGDLMAADFISDVATGTEVVTYYDSTNGLYYTIPIDTGFNVQDVAVCVGNIYNTARQNCTFVQSDKIIAKINISNFSQLTNTANTGWGYDRTDSVQVRHFDSIDGALEHRITNTNAGTAAYARISLYNDISGLNISNYSSNFVTANWANKGGIAVGGALSGFFISTSTIFQIFNASAVEKLSYNVATAVLSVTGTATITTSLTTPIVIGSTAASGTLTLRATSSATDGAIIFQSDPTTETGRILSTGELVWGATTVVSGEFVSIQKSQNAGTLLRIKNATSGTAASAGIGITNSANLSIGFISYSAGFTTSGMAVADMASLTVNTALGLNVGSTSATPVAFWTNNTQRGVILSTGELIWGATSLISSEKLSIQANANSATEIRIRNTTSGTAAYSGITITGGASSLGLYHLSAAFTTLNMNVASTSIIKGFDTGGMNIGNFSNAQLSFWTNNAKKISIPAAGGLVVGIAALATNATDGFLYIPTCAGTPTGVPTAQTGTVAMVFDTTNNKFYIYDGGWLGGTTPGAFT